MLSNHKLDINNNNKQDHKHPKANKKKEDKEEKETTPLFSEQTERRCYCCGKPGHKYTYCRTNDKIPKYEWTINKAQQYIQSNNDNAKITSGSSLSHKK